MFILTITLLLTAACIGLIGTKSGRPSLLTASMIYIMSTMGGFALLTKVFDWMFGADFSIFIWGVTMAMFFAGTGLAYLGFLVKLMVNKAEKPA